MLAAALEPEGEGIAEALGPEGIAEALGPEAS